MLAVADQHRAPANAEQVQQVARDALVARAQDADDRRAGDDCGRRETVRPELVVDSPREDERHHRDEHERRDDAADSRPLLALGVEPRLPEDEDRDQRQEREPLLLGLPGDAPERQLVLVVEPAQRERQIEPEREPADVDRQQRRDRRETSSEGAQRRTGEDRSSRRADVRGDGSALLVRRRLRVRRGAHEGRF